MSISISSETLQALPLPKEEHPVSERKGYDSADIISYINAAYSNNRLKPDNEVEGIPEADCKAIREYLQSFKLRGKSIVENIDSIYIVRLDRESLKKFIALQHSVSRV